MAGLKGKHDSTRRAVRHGSEPAKLPLGGRVLRVDKPRVRATDAGSADAGTPKKWAGRIELS